MTANKPTAEQVRTTPPPTLGLPQERRGESRRVEVPPSLDELARRVYGDAPTGSTHVSASANGGQIAAFGHRNEHATDNETDLGKIGRRMYGF